jgi:PAS domain S-box-containing protein
MQRSELIAFLGPAAAVWKRAKRPTALLREAGYILLGLGSLATVTGLYFWLDVPLVAAASTYLVVLVLLSLVINLSSLIVLSFTGVCCLAYFFAPPIYSFRVDYPQDLITISAFVITSFVVNFLVTRVRDANQRLEVTNKALLIENVERKRAEQALRESERGSRSAFDGIAGLVAVLAPNGELETVNRQLLEYFGQPVEWIKNWGTNDAVHPEDLPRVLERFKRGMASGIPYNQEFRIRRFDGEYRWFVKTGVSVQTRLSEKLYPVPGDRVQLQQVVLNLILNAAEAMGSVEAEPRELLISSEQDHTGVLVAVRDSGPGIHPADLDRVFESFYTTKPNGIGMGLSICRSIIEAHGGRLWATGCEPQGALFQFTIPRT